MGKAIPYDYRVKIVQRLQGGEKAKEVAQEFGYSESGIKKIWYSYLKQGDQAYKTEYGNCGRRQNYDDSIKKKVEELRDNNQGGGYIRSKLKQHYPDVQLPSERTIQRWWVQQGTNRKKGRPRDYEKKMESKTS
jgi:hypothetical protein